VLTEVESKRVLAAYGIPTVETRVAVNEDEAVVAAGAIGYPVVLKLHSRTITHKTEVGGVQLNLADADAVRRAFRSIEESVRDRVGPGHFDGVSVQPMVKLDGYELIVGSSLDPQFGPVLLFGTGGQLVEVFRDRALGLPPLNTTLARRMMEHTRILAALKGVRGRRPVDLAALEQLLVRFSDLVVQQRWIKEIDINPLLASPDRLLALDARVIVHGPEVKESTLPRPAIRPYPTHLAAPWMAGDGTTLLLRPIRPEDEPMLVAFHGTLSERTVALRYFHAMKLSTRVAHERLTRICFIDYDREMALVAERPAPEADGGREILGVGRLSKIRGTDDAEFALLISDRFQRRGLGAALLERLIGIARDEGIGRIVGSILPENLGMRRVCEKLGFRMSHDPEDGVVKAELVP
jgi:acetyltransferase